MKEQNYKIEKNITIPDKRDRNGVTDILRKMKVGESIVIPKKIRYNAYQYAIRAHCEITVRSISEDEVRVWVTKRTREAT